MNFIFRGLAVVCFVTLTIAAPNSDGTDKSSGRKPKTAKLEIKGLNTNQDKQARSVPGTHILLDLTIDGIVEEFEAVQKEDRGQQFIKTQALLGDVLEPTEKHDVSACKAYELEKGTVMVCNPDDDVPSMIAHLKTQTHEDCIVMSTENTALCKPIENVKAGEVLPGFEQLFMPPELNFTQEKRDTNDIPNIEDYGRTNIMKCLVIVDSFFVEPFRAIAASETEAIDLMTLYMYLLFAEVNQMYRSVYEESLLLPDIPTYELLIFVSEIIYPAVGLEVPFAKIRPDGELYGFCTGGPPCEDTFLALGEFVQSLYDNDLIPGVDATTFMTGRDMYVNEDPIVIGVAWVGIVCLPPSVYGNFMVSLVEADFDSIFDVASILAHELGHSFGTLHDGDPTFNNNCPIETYIMSPSYIVADDITKETYARFSDCSVREIYNRLELIRNVLGVPNCLDVPSRSDIWEEQFCVRDGKGRGAFSLQEQCYFNTLIPNSDACISAAYPNGLLNGKVHESACWAENVVGCTDGSGVCNRAIKIIGSGTPCYNSSSTVDEDMICFNRACVHNNDQVCCDCTDERCCRVRGRGFGLLRCRPDNCCERCIYRDGACMKP